VECDASDGDILRFVRGRSASLAGLNCRGILGTCCGSLPSRRFGRGTGTVGGFVRCSHQNRTLGISGCFVDTKRARCVGGNTGGARQEGPTFCEHALEMATSLVSFSEARSVSSALLAETLRSVWVWRPGLSMGGVSGRLWQQLGFVPVATSARHGRFHVHACGWALYGCLQS
jgi:hypothetical protein